MCFEKILVCDGWVWARELAFILELMFGLLGLAWDYRIDL